MCYGMSMNDDDNDDDDDDDETVLSGLVVACCAEVGRSRVRGRVGAGLKTVLPIISSFYRSHEVMGRGG